MATPPSPPTPIPPILTFEGVGFSSGVSRGFEAMCGPLKPTPVGGYAVWTEVVRPLADSLTIFTNRGATGLSINVIFGFPVGGGWQTDNATGQAVEDAISTLEWMGGQGFDAGPSPYINMWSHSSQGGETTLIPSIYQGSKGRSFPWIISDGIQWGTAYVNGGGFRVWQEATFLLKNYLNLNKPPTVDTNMTGGYFVSKPGRDKALLIAGGASVRSPMEDHQALASRILAAHENNPIAGTSIHLQGRSVYWTIRHGLRVFVPGHTIF